MEHLRDMSFKARFLRILSTPFIFGVAVPIVITDICVEIYHRISFPLYGIEYVKRSDYIRVWDRGKLQYLNPLQKIFCVYCGYVNGVMAYWVEVAGRTEKYWCGIQHVDEYNLKNRNTHKDFTHFADEEDFNRKYRHCKLKK